MLFGFVELYQDLIQINGRSVAGCTLTALPPAVLGSRRLS
jgi:hypothetical protein